MTDILLIAANRPEPGVFTDAVSALRELGATVRLAVGFELGDEDEALARAGVELHQLPPTFHGRSSVVRREAEHVTPGERLWLRSAPDGRLRSLAREARMLVALDADAVYMVWRLARRHRGARALFGVLPAVRAVRCDLDLTPANRFRAALPSPAVLAGDARRAARRLPGNLVRAGTVRRVMRTPAGARMWRSLVALPALPQRTRATLGRHVAEGMHWAGRPSGAALTLLESGHRVADLELRTALYDEAAKAEIGAGLAPRALPDAVAAWLRLADRRLAEGDRIEAATALHNALPLAFHRSVHIDRLTSPLADDVHGFTGPLLASRALDTVAAAARGRATPAAAPPADRPLRLLVVTSTNANFLQLVLEEYANRPDVELRFLDLSQNKELSTISWSHWRILADRLDAYTAYRNRVERAMRPHLDWADTVFLDWCTGPAAMLTTIDPGTARVVLRLHSYEAFTRWPLLVDFSRVDELLFIGDHLRELCTSYVPQLAGGGAPAMRVLHNAVDLTPFARPKSDDARFTLGLIGVSQVVKDPMWALDVLERVRAHDERYRLVIVGNMISPETSRAAHDYRAVLDARLAPLERIGAVERRAQTDDVAHCLTDIGVILSSSVRESRHLAVVEGAASGAVPVVRDWPFFSGQEHGARTAYPPEWVAADPEEAAHRILRTTSDPERWRAEGEECAKHALSTWDWSVVRRDFDEVLTGSTVR